MTDRWSGDWVCQALGIELRSFGAGLAVGDLAGMALRRNPKRSHLLVSTVLGKHVPTDPRVVHGAGLLLGTLAAAALAGRTDSLARQQGAALLRAGLGGSGEAAKELISFCQRYSESYPSAAGITALGYAETATGLGHTVAECLDADYLHSTRRPVDTFVAVGMFDEAHSHATEHLLLPADASLLRGPGPVVLVDDELSTGQTALNTIAALDGIYHRRRYLIATLVDMRSPADRQRCAETAATLGVQIDVVSLASGCLTLPPDVLERGQRLVAHLHSDHLATPAAATVGPMPTQWPVGVLEGARHGFTPGDKPALLRSAAVLAAGIAGLIENPATARVLVLGFEELMYAPLQIALALTEQLALSQVRFSSTTRSPVLAQVQPGYAIQSRLSFASHDSPADGQGPRFAYNVAPVPGQAGFTDVVLVIDERANTPELRASGGLLAELEAVCGRVHLVVLPTNSAERAGHLRPLYGPQFGSYARAEVAWLLTDLSAIELEAPTEEREEAIQSGGAHYAESLPIEYQPDASYRALFTEALTQSAARVAREVGIVTELVLAARGPGAVLVSLARAGTPVGILMRRWAEFAHGLELAHYAVSIVRGRGIDSVAMQYLSARHDSTLVMFVDGWTGKGAIVRELAAAVEATNEELGTQFSAALAVLADTGHCVDIFGTRADYLIPSACLNSTVSGLVSRTVLNDELIQPGMFHGAKFYAELADADVSDTFLDAVSEQFGAVAAAVAQQWPVAQRSDRQPSFRGWRAVEKISAEYGIGDVNLIKPGVGETTRVLLRRVPWKVLMRPDAANELGHIRLLASQRGVPVELVEDLAYSCVGLIQPSFRQ